MLKKHYIGRIKTSEHMFSQYIIQTETLLNPFTRDYYSRDCINLHPLNVPLIYRLQLVGVLGVGAIYDVI